MGTTVKTYIVNGVNPLPWTHCILKLVKIK